MTTEQQIQQLAQAVRLMSSELAYALRTIGSDLDDLRLSDKARLTSSAERIEQISDQLNDLIP